MAKLPGSIWVEGDTLRYIDGSGVEWQSPAYYLWPCGAGAKPGSIWIEDDSIRYVNEAGTVEWGIWENPNVAKPYTGGISGSLWVESNLIHWLNPSNERDNHWDVAPVVGHGDIAHVNVGAHTDTPHTNTHTDSHGNVAHQDRAHTDHNDHDDTPHTDSHTNTHGDSAHQDHSDHGDYGTHYDAIYFLNDPPPGHSDTQYHGDTPDNYTDHTNVAHVNTHGDVAHKDTAAYSHQDHQDIVHLDSHTDSHSDVAHVDVAHGDSGSHSDSPHTNTHTDEPHIDAPYYIGP